MSTEVDLITINTLNGLISEFLENEVPVVPVPVDLSKMSVVQFKQTKAMDNNSFTLNSYYKVPVMKSA